VIQMTHDLYLNEATYKCPHCERELYESLDYKRDIKYCLWCYKSLIPSPTSLYKSTLIRIDYHFFNKEEKADEVEEKA
jgi:hypothetical protein